MQIGMAVGDVRGPATLAEIVGQVQQAADAGLATAWSAQALSWDALMALAVAAGYAVMALIAVVIWLLKIFNLMGYITQFRVGH